MNKLEEISQHIVERFIKCQEDEVKSEGKRTAVHVSALTNCIRKAWYSMHADKQPPLDYKSICNFFLGHILHKHAVLGNRNEVKMAVNLRTMTKIDDPNTINEFNKFDCVVGTADDIIELEGDIIIADKKTFNGARNTPKAPDPAYVTQINIYKLLLYVCEGIEAKYGCILYLDKSKSFQDPIPFTFELDPIEKIKTETIKKLDYLKMLIPPEREITWKCNYCDFKKICNPPEFLIPKFHSK
jgi:CRISPR/Cas system-associated exonuclease Cas4 (RecB family)